METSYGIGVTNRFGLFLDEEDASDPYALLTNAADSEPKAKATASAAGGKSGPKTVGAPATAKPAPKPAPGALSESKANVVANQKDAGMFHDRFLSLCALEPPRHEPTHSF